MKVKYSKYLLGIPLRSSMRQVSVLVFLIYFLFALPSSAQNSTFPVTDAPVWASALSQTGDTLYIGGQFTTVGGKPRKHIASIVLSTEEVTAWNPDADAPVAALAVSGNTVYVGGSFTRIAGQVRYRIAALDVITGKAVDWYTGADGPVAALAVSGSTIYAGGGFRRVDGRERWYVSALDSMGKASAWNPDADGPVTALAVSGSTIYAGGAFTRIGGRTRNYIAALDMVTGEAISWNPDADGPVNTLAVSGNTVYAGGAFTRIGGHVRNRIAALDMIKGEVTAWNPDANSLVLTLAVSQSQKKVYAGGDFASIAGYANLQYLASLRDPFNKTFNDVISVDSQTFDHLLEQPIDIIIWPNPVRESINIQFDMQSSRKVTIEIYTAIGVKVATLIERGEFNNEFHYLHIPLGNLTAGLYTMKISTGSAVQSQIFVVCR